MNIQELQKIEDEIEEMGNKAVVSFWKNEAIIEMIANAICESSYEAIADVGDDAERITKVAKEVVTETILDAEEQIMIDVRDAVESWGRVAADAIVAKMKNGD